MRKVLFLALFAIFLAIPASAAPRYVEGEAIVAVKMSADSGSLAANAASARASSASAAAVAQDAGVELIQTFSPVPAADAVTAQGAKSASANGGMLALAHVRGKKGEDAAGLIARLKKDPRVVSAMPNYMMSVSAVTPSDPKWTEQWGPERIKLPEVWNHGTGSREVVAVVFDTGVLYDHEDLRDNMFVFDETLLNKIAANGVSLDAEEFADSHGVWYHTKVTEIRPDGEIFGDAFSAVPVGPGDTGEATSEDVDSGVIDRMRLVGDVNGHGTHVAGTIGAVGNNGTGIAGVNWNVKLMAVNVFSRVYNAKKNWYETSALISDQLRAIDFILAAKKAGANIRVVNMSLGMWAEPAEEEIAPYGEKIKQLSDAGIIVCAAAGNQGQDLDDPQDDYRDKLHYPACFKFDNLISVGASTSGDGCASFSNYSASGKWVDVFAPGQGILSTCRKTWIVNPSDEIDTYDPSGYISISGTSMASPHAAGAAALLCALYPGKSAAEIRSLLLDGAEHDVLGAGYSKYGMLNVLSAYNRAQPSDGGGSGGGCAAGFGALALAGAVLLPLVRRLKKK